jgi:TolB-like protein
MSPDPDNEYFSDGITEEIINALCQLPSLSVAARTSTFAFKGKTIEIADVGKKLKVATVLAGSVRKAGNRVRITAELINVADGYHLWSERYDSEMDDIFALQDHIARAIALRFELTLAGPTGRLAQQLAGAQ